MYYDIINSAKPFDIIFRFKKEGMINKLIWWFEKKDEDYRKEELHRTAHVMLALENGMMTEVDWPGLIISKLPKKVSAKKYEMYLGTVNVPFDPERMKNSINNLKGKVVYDYLRLPIIACGIFIERIKKGWKVKDYNKNAMICSEYIATLFAEGKAILVPGTELCDVKPIDLMASKKVTLRHIPVVE